MVTLSLASISQLAVISISIMSKLPLAEAQCKGALPYWKAHKAIEQLSESQVLEMRASLYIATNFKIR